MSKNKILMIFCALLFIITGFSENVYSNAHDQNNIGVRGIAMTSAFTGISDDASAIYYNPGGLVNIEDGMWNIEGSVLTIFSGFKYVNTTGATDKEFESTEMANIPGVFAATSSGDLAYGIGLYAPFGGGSAVWKDVNGPGYNFEALAAFLAITPSIAYRVIPDLSVGLGVSAYYGMMELNNESASAMEQMEVAYSSLAGYGFNLGIMYKASDELNIGLAIKSPISIGIEGTHTMMGDDYDSEIEFTLPWYWVIGVGYQVTPDLLIDIDFWYMKWGNMDKLTLNWDDSDPITAFTGDKVEMKTYYQDSIAAMLGAEYTASKELTIRGGLRYEQQVSEDKAVSINSNCDIDRITLSVGAGYNITESVEAALSLAYVHGMEKEIDASVTGGTPGKYSQAHKFLTIGIRADL